MNGLKEHDTVITTEQIGKIPKGSRCVIVHEWDRVTFEIESIEYRAVETARLDQLQKAEEEK